MIALLEFSPLQPTPGLAIWSFVIFMIFFFIMKKYAFGPIVDGLTKREGDIQEALDTAKKTKVEMANMKAENEKLLAEAREERTKILQEAKDLKNQIVGEAKETAKIEANKILTNAMVDIENQKKQAIEEVKNQVGNMAIAIAEKVIRKELAGNSEQETFVNALVKEIKLN